jgi:hypothetical protein
MGCEGNQCSIMLHCEHSACSKDAVMVTKCIHTCSNVYLSFIRGEELLPE